MHSDEDDAFYIVEGEMTFIFGDQSVAAPPGTFVLVPPDTEHGLRIVGTGEARWLAIWPAALDGLVEELLTLDRDDEPGAARVRRRHGIEPGRDRREGR